MSNERRLDGNSPVSALLTALDHAAEHQANTYAGRRRGVELARIAAGIRLFIDLDPLNRSQEGDELS